MSPGDQPPNDLHFGRQRLVLTVIGPSDERETVQVDRSPFRIGRLPDRELTLKDGRISRNHAQIILEDGRYFIEDNDSRHGVYVNRRKVDRELLRPRDRVDFGVDDSYHVLIGEESAPEEPLLKKVADMAGADEGTGSLTRLSAVLDVARALESSGTVDDVLAAAVDAALTLTGAERGFLMLKGADGELRVRLARDQDGAALGEEDLEAPRRVIADALAERSDLFAMSFDPAAQMGGSEPGPAQGQRNVVCVPLVRIRIGEQTETQLLSTARDTLGVLYMDTRQAGADLAEGAGEALQTLAIEISTVLENARLLEAERKKHHLEQELQIAREIQQALLPARLPEEGWFVAAGSSDACFQVGGDYFDVMQLPPNHWGAALVDVSGKGVSAALLASLLQGAFFSAASSDASLKESVGRINRYVCERSRHARFATAFCCVVDRAGALRWVNAGHCAGMLVRQDGSVEHLEPTGYPIGLFEDAQFPEKAGRMEAGDKLILFSDGVSEAANWNSDRFGDDRLEAFVSRFRSLGAGELHRDLLREVGAFTNGVEQVDDLTLLVLGYQG